MSKYAYTARSSSFQELTGVIEADSELDAINRLAQKGHYPLSLVPGDVCLPDHDLFSAWRISRKDVLAFTRQLSTLLGSGVNIISALTLIGDQCTNKYFQPVVMDIRDRIREGAPLSEGLAAYPSLFSGLYTALVHSGEVSGNLDGTLKRLFEFLEKEDVLKDELLAALTYPLFICGVGVITMVVLVGFVMPKLIVMFADMGQTLPLPTMILITVSRGLSQFWWAIAGVMGAAGYFLYRFYQTEDGRYRVDTIKIRMFLLKDIIIKTEISRFMRTFALLLTGGIETVTALEGSCSVLKNSVLKREASGFRDRIMKGGSLSQCLRGSKLFPAFVTNIISVGEESGSLEQSLLSIAGEYERDVDRMVKTLTRLLEPAIILVMGLVVGFIVLAMLLPIFQMNLMAQ